MLSGFVFFNFRKSCISFNLFLFCGFVTIVILWGTCVDPVTYDIWLPLLYSMAWWLWPFQIVWEYLIGSNINMKIRFKVSMTSCSGDFDTWTSILLKARHYSHMASHLWPLPLVPQMWPFHQIAQMLLLLQLLALGHSVSHVVVRLSPSAQYETRRWVETIWHMLLQGFPVWQILVGAAAAGTSR